jgi:hypothetical protein
MCNVELKCRCKNSLKLLKSVMQTAYIIIAVIRLQANACSQMRFVFSDIPLCHHGRMSTIVAYL